MNSATERICSGYVLYAVCNLFSLIKQKQIAQGIKFGQRPPSLRKSEGDEEYSEEEEIPPSPLKVLAQVEVEPANTEPKVKKLLTYSIDSLVLFLEGNSKHFYTSKSVYRYYMWPFVSPEKQCEV